MHRGRIAAVAAVAGTLVGLGATATGAGAAVPGIPSSYPGASLAPIKAMSYQPAPSNYVPGAGIFFDSDFYNDSFAALWSSANGGRGDLATMAADGVNLLHLYDWNPQRNHTNFLNAAQAQGIGVAVPVSNYFVGTNPSAISQVVNQIYVDSGGNPSKTPHPAVPMITVGNEYEISGLTAAQVANAIAQVVAAEQALGATQTLPIAVPVSFGLFGGQVPGVVPTQNVMTAIQGTPGLGQAFLTSRFIAATNPQNPGSYLSGPVAGAADYYAAFAAAIPSTPLWFSEMGAGQLLSCTGYPSTCQPGAAQQAVFNADQFAAAVPGSGGILLGGTQFEFEDEMWKGNPATTNDSTFGVYTFPWPAAAGTPSQSSTMLNGPTGPYFVDPLTAKPSLASMRDAFSSTWNVTAASATARPRGLATPRALDPRDVVQLDRDTGERRVIFDGSKEGLGRRNALAAVTTAPDGKSLLLSVQRRARLDGIGRVVPNDVVRYDLADGTFTRVVHVDGRPIDAIAEPAEGGLIISRRGHSHLLQQDGDCWTRIAKERQIGLTLRGEDIDALWSHPESGDLYVSTVGRSRTGHVRTRGGDVLALSRGDDGWHARVVMRGDQAGFDGAQVRGFAIGGPSSAAARR